MQVDWIPRSRHYSQRVHAYIDHPPYATFKSSIGRLRVTWMYERWFKVQVNWRDEYWPRGFLVDAYELSQILHYCGAVQNPRRRKPETTP